MLRKKLLTEDLFSKSLNREIGRRHGQTGLAGGSRVSRHGVCCGGVVDVEEKKRYKGGETEYTVCGRLSVEMGMLVERRGGRRDGKQVFH